MMETRRFKEETHYVLELETDVRLVFARSDEAEVTLTVECDHEDEDHTTGIYSNLTEDEGKELAAMLSAVF